MKKLMFAAAVAAMTTGAFADLCSPVEPVTEAIARIYRIELRAYTTKGVLTYSSTTSQGSTCVPGQTTTDCVVRRAKDKTVIRGYMYTCADLCDLEDYGCGFVDYRRKAPFGEFDDQGGFTTAADLTPRFLNFMGKYNTDVEIAWDFTGTVTYDSARAQTYTLVGAGYGTLGSGTTVFADKLSGYFSGTVTAPYDLVTAATTATAACVCEPSKVLTCSDYGTLTFTDSDSIAFGMWKMRYSATLSKAYLAGTWNIATALQQLLK